MRIETSLVDVKTATVRKANELIQKSRFSLSLQQQKIVLYLISQINPWDEDFKLYELPVTEFCRVVGIDSHLGGRDYKQLKDSLLDLINKAVWIDLNDNESLTVSWLEKAYFNKKSGLIRIRLDNDMKPFLLHLKQNFTSYELIYTLGFKSKYTLRLYELIKSIHFHELEAYKRIYKLEELKLLMDCDKLYNDFRDFKKRALDVAVNEINSSSDKNLSYTQITQGRKVVAIEFSISSKSSIETLKIRDEIEKELGIDPNQISLWDTLNEKRLVE